MFSSDLIVVDTSTLMGAFLFQGSVPAQALRKARTQAHVLLSAETLVELTKVLAREKFDRWIDPTSRLILLADFVSTAILAEALQAIQACRDPKDDKFLSLAVSAGAVYLISSDADLLALDPFRGVRILSPRDYLLM